MTTLGWVLGIAIIINLCLNLAKRNWYTALAWFVCILEWTRRFN